MGTPPGAGGLRLGVIDQPGPITYSSGASAPGIAPALLRPGRHPGGTTCPSRLCSTRSPA